MMKGSQPTDDGFLTSISDEEASRIRESDPLAAKYLRRLLGADELINGIGRWCLWLVDANPADLRASAEIRMRVEGVQKFRSLSKKEKTRDDASFPHLFQERRQPLQDYLAVPRVSSEHRKYIPMSLEPLSTIANDRLMTIPNADLFTFGILHGRPFQVWNVNVSGRLQSRFSISAEITYNNYPWPEAGADARKAIEHAAQEVLSAREVHAGATLADLYGPQSMPADLVKAHEVLDKAVMTAYGLKPAATDAEVLGELFARYERLVAPLAGMMGKKSKRR
jgi:hypothetical protein